MESRAKSLAWPGFWRLALAGFGLQAEAGISLEKGMVAGDGGGCHRTVTEQAGSKSGGQSGGRPRLDISHKRDPDLRLTVR